MAIQTRPADGRDAGIFLEDYAGTFTNNKCDAVLAAANFDNLSGNTVVLPNGWTSLDDTLTFVKGGTPANASQLLTGWKLEGQQATTLWWDASVVAPVKKAMVEVLMTNRMEIGGFQINGRHFGVALTTDRIAGTIGLWLRPAYAYNGNTSREVTIRNLRIQSCDIGVMIGDSTSPDFTSYTFIDCTFHQCPTPVKSESANITSITFQNCGFNGQELLRAAHVISQTARNFDAGEVLDPWGDPIAQDWTDIYSAGGQTVWNDLVFDLSGRNRNHVDFVHAEAYQSGGGPQLSFRDCDFTAGYGTGLVKLPFVRSEGCDVRIDGLRIENQDTLILEQLPSRLADQSSGTANLMNGVRFMTDLRNISTFGETWPQIIIEDINGTHNAGRPITVSNINFRTSIPAENHNLNRYIRYEGFIWDSTNQKVIHPGALPIPLVEYTFGEGSGTTLTDSGSLGENLTITGTATRGAGPQYGAHGVFDGSTYAESAGVIAGLDNDLIEAISFDFMMTDISTADKQHAGIVGKRDTGTNAGWCVTLDDGNTLRLIVAGSPIVMTGITLVKDIWYKAAMSTSGGTLTWWINGKEYSSHSFSTLGTEHNAEALQVGWDASFANRKFHGSLANVRLYGTELYNDLLVKITS